MAALGSSIEHLIQQALFELGFANPVARGQTYLLHKRQLVGRRFCFDGVDAVWRTGEGQIKIFDAEGEVLRMLEVVDEQDGKAVA
jgi:hypothetical protein